MTKTIWCWLFVAIYLAGCTTVTERSYPVGDPASGVKPGDRAVITTGDGVYKFKVVRATAEEICGDDECVRADRIEQVRTEEVSAWKTAALVVGIVLLVGLAAAASGGIGFVGFPGPPVFP